MARANPPPNRAPLPAAPNPAAEPARVRAIAFLDALNKQLEANNLPVMTASDTVLLNDLLQLMNLPDTMESHFAWVNKVFLCPLEDVAKARRGRKVAKAEPEPVSVDAIIGFVLSYLIVESVPGYEAILDAFKKVFQTKGARLPKTIQRSVVPDVGEFPCQPIECSNTIVFSST